MKFIPKSLSRIALGICIAFAAQSCIVTAKTKPVHSASKPLPPGQAKKVTGSQSAKPYAPGQQNKKK